MTKRVVILVPAYRCETTIVDTLDSIQQQGAALNRVQRVIVADDGSRDRSADLARRAWKAPVDLQVLERRFNCGEYASVNNAVEQFSADADWFLIMHADNIAKPGWLATFLDRIEEASDDVGLIGSSYDCFSDGGPTRPGENDPNRIVTVLGTNAAVRDTLVMGCWWHISSCAIRIATFLQVGGLPKVMQLKGDWDFMLRVLSDGWTIEYIPLSLMLYRDNQAGSSSVTFRRHMDIWETMTVVGRFHAALNGGLLFRVHARHFWYLVRRATACLVRPNIVRLLWVFPAMGCVFASYWTCRLGATKKTAITSRRPLLQSISSE